MGLHESRFCKSLSVHRVIVSLKCNNSISVLIKNEKGKSKFYNILKT